MAKKQRLHFFDLMEFPQYVFREFPKVMHGPGGKTVTVDNISEQRSLGAGWFANAAEAKQAELDAKSPTPFSEPSLPVNKVPPKAPGPTPVPASPSPLP